MKKIDFHTHILPAIDDGATDMEMSLNMLNQLQMQSVQTVVLTPHYYSQREPIEKFIDRRNEAVNKLFVAAQSMPIEFRIGAEVHFSEYLFNNEDLSALCIDGTKTMLLELPFAKKVDMRVISLIERLCYEYAVTPVLAHIERYPNVLKSNEFINKLVECGCVFQINLSSFTEFGKGKLLSYAKKGLIGAIGTDSHNLTSRKPNYDDGYRYLSKHLSTDDLQYIHETMQWLLGEN